MQLDILPRTIPQIVPYFDHHETTAVLQTIEAGWITEGPQALAFVESLKQVIGVPFGVLAPNGTMALSLGLMAIGIGPGDEVLIPDITFIGSANAVLMVGATPIFVDVEPETFQIDVTHAGKCLTSRTRAIMPVHLYGTACDMGAINLFARQHQLLIIEDAAQGIGVFYDSSHVGSLGDVGCFSFFADKTITTGEGGFVACRDERVFERLCLLRNQGRIERGSFVHPAVGFNFRMTDMQAAIGLTQLNKLAHIIDCKQKLWQAYVDGLNGIHQVRVLGPAPNSNHVPFRCVLIAEQVQKLQQALEQVGVQTRSFFYPLHRQPCFQEETVQFGAVNSLPDAEYPNANYGFEHGLCLPIYPTMTLDDVRYIVYHVRQHYQATL